MSVYIWKCEDCGAQFDVYVTPDVLKRICPKCGKERVRKVYTPPTLIFKGPGFYVNDKDK